MTLFPNEELFHKIACFLLRIPSIQMIMYGRHLGPPFLDRWTSVVSLVAEAPQNLLPARLVKQHFNGKTLKPFLGETKLEASIFSGMWLI